MTDYLGTDWTQEAFDELERQRAEADRLRSGSGPAWPSDISGLQRRCIENSRRWFPTLHAADPLTLLMYTGLGLAGEAGEVADGIKKVVRTALRVGYPSQDPEQQQRLAHVAEELADVAAYLFNLAEILGVDIGVEMAKKAAYNETREWSGGAG